ncbi:MAG TPA: alpha/beta fold hydrolase [Myxococcales bacterium]|jgi:phospholipase/carboxylesterase|nr:alpha/beta fold hydrolase [Myxococcales bacterium]
MTLKTIDLPPRAPGLSRTLVLLHGYGADEHDLLELGHLLDPRLRVVSLQAPVAMGGRQRAWYMLSQDARGNLVADPAQVQAGLKAAVDAVEVIAQQSPQPFLLGFSQGGGIAASILLTRPELIAGAISMSGALQPIEQISPEARGKPLFAGHGRQDPVVSLQRGLRVKEAAEQAGLALEWREYDMGHQIIPDELRDAQVWLSGRL